MSKIKKQDIPRGVRLDPAHTHGTIAAAGTQIGNAVLEREQFEKGQGVFRCMWNTPNLSADYFGVSNNLYTIPFHFPPLNEFFSTQGITETNTPTIHLREVGFYWDSRGEASAVNEMGPDNRGFLTNQAERIGLKIKLYEKQIGFWGGIGAIPSKQVYSQEFPAGSFSSELQLPLLPTFQDGLNIEIKPYHSYLWTIEATGLVSDDPLTHDHLCLPSLTITGKFISPLIPRTENTGLPVPITNIPARHDGNKRTQGLGINIPAGGDIVSADDDTTYNYALQKQIEKIDDRVREGLTGGYDEFSARANVESIDDDSCYEVICLNLMGGWKDIRGADVDKWENLPQMTTAGTGYFFDRRQVPINYPLEIHKVYFWKGNQTPNDPNNLQQTNFSPNLINRDHALVAPRVADTTTYELGVGLGTHQKGTNVAFSQVAYLNATPGFTTTQIDTLQPYNNTQLGPQPLWSLFQVPMVRDASINPIPTAGSYLTQDYYATGPIYYVGKSAITTDNAPGFSLLTDRRNNVFDATGASIAPPTQGQENFLEVTLKVSGTNLATPPNDADLIVPYGGYWVYLICKKTTIS